MLLIIAATSCLTVFLLLAAMMSGAGNPARERVRALGTDRGSGRADQGFSGRIVFPAARRSTRMVLELLPHRWVQRLERGLIVAGEPMDIATFVLLCIAATLFGAFAGVRFYGPLGLPLGGGAGLALALYWLRRAGRKRKQRISNALPDTIDLLVTCVEAGLGLDAALIRAGEAAEGPLGDEIRTTVRQIAVGRPRQDALLDLGQRTGVADLDGFIRPVVQAERSGVSIGTALRVQAESLRVKRRQRAQTAAQTMAVKITIPIAFCFIPALLIVTGGMAVLAFMDAVGGG